jgi:FKBP-type peptidyl-prolyl cis-trans isomerase
MSKITEEKITLPEQAHAARSRRLRCGASAVLAGIALIGVCHGAGVQGADTPVAMDKTQTRAGYSAGYAFGGQLAKLQRQAPGIELEAVFRGILDALSGAESRLSAVEMRAALQSIEHNGAADSTPPRPRARVRGYRDDFAALNAKREGVVVLPSGVQYEVLKAAAGRQPGAGDAVLVNYQASLTNGAVFDSTYEDGEPVRMRLDEIVVPGLKEALLLMTEGAKWRVVIPPHMGFGRSGNNQLRRRDLIYEIELVAIEAPAGRAATPDTEAKSAGTVAVPDSTPASPVEGTPEPVSPNESPEPG